MENTYIIFDEGFEKQAEFIKTELSIERISYQAHENERGFHEWLTREFKNKDIQRLLIPLSLPSKEENTEGLLLGLHIRLNYELPIEKRSVPIVFITGLSVENIISKSGFDKDNNPQDLFFTEGIYISSSDIDEIKQKLKVAMPVMDYDLFLRKLNVRRKDDFGGHDIANAWGCYKLARVVGISDIVFSKESIAKHLKQLYAKYLICVNESYNDSKMSYVDLQPISCSGRRILFVDDKFDEGWGDLMSKIFKSAGNGLVCVDSSKYKVNGNLTDYEGFIAECKSYIGQRWDLIIIDIRLNPSIEDVESNTIPPTEFSGYKLIDAFLNNNKGYQILVSTASNKIWNVNAALKRGAKGYYIKESPEFNYPIFETKKQFEDFKTDVKKCFEDSYLQDIFKSIKEDIELCLPKNDFGKSISKQLNIAYYLISLAETQEQYAFAYVTLYLIIELINKEFLIQDANGGWCIKSNQSEKIKAWSNEKNVLLDFSYAKDNFGHKIKDNNGNDVVIQIANGNATSEWQKIVGVIKQQLKANISDNKLIELSYRVRARNWFIHGDSKLDDCKRKNDSVFCKDCKECFNVQTNKYDEEQRNAKRDNNECIFSRDTERQIYSKDGFQNLFKIIQQICSYL